MSETCEMCGGTGIIITCCDDMCNGIGHCIHGDGEEVCPTCGGEGDICDEDECRGQGDDEEELMGYTTSTCYRTADRIILDIRALSISLWTKPRLWSWFWRGWLWFCAGPIEVMWHRHVA